MTYVPYRVTGKTEKTVREIMAMRKASFDRTYELAKEFGAVGAVRQGSRITGFVFDKEEDKPDRWIWERERVIHDGKWKEFARPQARSKADKALWERIRSVEYDSGRALNKLFYGDPWGFRTKDNNRLLGVGVLCRDDGCVVEIAFGAEVNDDMAEILRSEYEAFKGKEEA